MDIGLELVEFKYKANVDFPGAKEGVLCGCVQLKLSIPLTSFIQPRFSTDNENIST